MTKTLRGSPPFGRSRVISHEIGERDRDHRRFLWGRLGEALDGLADSGPDAILAVTIADSLWGRTQHSPHYLALLAVDRWTIRAGLGVSRCWRANERVLYVAIEQDSLSEVNP